MRIGPVPAPSTQALLGTLTPVLPDARLKQVSAPTREQVLFSPDPANRSTCIESTTDHDLDATSAIPHSREDEDEYTLCAYGDISLSDVMVPPLLAPTHPGVLQPQHPQPRLRPKMRRPPMPKRRSSYIYVPDPWPHTGGMDSGERWPGSSRPFAHNSPWIPHQPLLPPLPTTSRAQGIKPAKKDDSSLERLFDELIPSSLSIRLSPPGSPPNQALSLPQETCMMPAPQQDKPQEAPWRQRLPPRLPIPRWDA